MIIKGMITNAVLMITAPWGSTLSATSVDFSILLPLAKGPPPHLGMSVTPIPDEDFRDLCALVERLNENGLRCKLEECLFAHPDTLSRQGISKDHNRQNATTNGCFQPALLSGLSRILREVPNEFVYINRTIKPLNQVPEQQTAFQHQKHLFCMDTVQAHFDPSQDIGISCCTTEVRIGAVLFHLMLTVVSDLLETHQRQAVCCNIQTNTKRSFGGDFHVTEVQSVSIRLAVYPVAKRLARWTLMLIQYDHSMECWKTADHGNAHPLSRLRACEDMEFDEKEKEVEVDTLLSLEMAEIVGRPVKTAKPKSATKESKKDGIISSVIRYIKKRWPQPQTADPEKALCFRKLQHSLSTDSGRIFCGQESLSLTVCENTSDQFDSLLAFPSTTDEAIRSFSGRIQRQYFYAHI
ncbi:hypothetical protein T07_11302, partial [Trichinella nelsoni]